MNITAHPVAPEEIMAFLDSELSAAEAQAVSAHIERCADCAKLAEQFRSTSQSLARWNVEAIPGKLDKSIADSTTKAGSRLDLGKPNVFIRCIFWSWKQWALAGGGAVATLLFAVMIFMLSRSPWAMKETDTLVAPAQEGRNKLGAATIRRIETPRKL